MLKKAVLFFVALMTLQMIAADVADVVVVRDIAYKSGDNLSDYEKTRCKLDLYAPAGKKDLPCIVWFHGGALSAGDKGGSTAEAARALAADGHLVAAVNYRLSPKATYPAYVEDAAAAVAWMHQHAAEHRGNSKKIFVSGHSAGGYLTFMLGMDGRWLKPHKLSPADLAGLIPVSGQTTTHSTVRLEREIPKERLIADDASPLYHVSKDLPPMLILYAEKEMAMRGEENQLIFSALKAAGNKSVTIRQIAGRDHGGIGNRISEPDDTVRPAMAAFIKQISEKSAGQ